MQQLKSGSLLQGGRYKIEKVLGQGGFGITYLAIQELLNRKVCIKEFFFKEYCERDEATSQVSLGTTTNRELVERFMEKFIKEARTISALNHPHIIRIYDIFKENNTAYYVMEYIEGESLAKLVKQRGALPEDMAVAYIRQVASALDFVHQHSINHLDVKPANIMVRKEDNQAVLIDFGLSKQYDAQGGQTSTTPVGISHGYAPMEQYKQGGVSTFSPQTDIYALGATLYKLVTGNTPPQAMDILDEGLPSLPSSLSSSVAEKIKKAMQPRKVDRPKSIDEFIDGLSLSLQNSSFVQNKTNSQQNPAIDEETMVLDSSNVKSVKYEDESSQFPITADSNEAEKLQDGGRRFKFIMYILLVGVMIVFFAKTCGDNIGNSNSVVVGKSAQDYYNEALKYDYANYDKAIPLFVEASKLGYADASLHLGWCYRTGKGVTKNARTAFEWYLKAAAQGSIIAEYNLGNCYYNGEGVTKNLEEAKKWLEKAANHGDKDAMELLEQIKNNSTNKKGKASEKNSITQGKVTLSDGSVRKENFQEKQSSSKSKSKIVIEGYVGDINGPVIAASVVEKGTNNGTVTDFDGRFSLTVNSDAIIRVEFIGYKARESAAQKNMSFMLVEE